MGRPSVFLLRVPLVVAVTLLRQPLAAADETPRADSAPSRGTASQTVTVTPLTPTGPERFADSSGFTAQFTVKNVGTFTDTYDLSCDGYSTPIVCTNT